MDTSKDLELDIEQIKSVINKCACLYKNTARKFEFSDKALHSRKNFIIFQFRNIFDCSFWF